jgi:uncharacterized membrane protein
MGFRDWFGKRETLDDFLSSDEQAKVVSAIGTAERRTSGELRIHLELHCPGDPVNRAAEVFSRLGMGKTELHNGVLIYCALKDRRFAVYGDAGIHERLGQTYWQELVEHVQQEIRGNSLAAGLALAAESIGKRLSDYFPRAADDRDELPDDISFHNN